MHTILSSIHIALPWLFTAAIAFSLSRHIFHFGLADSFLISATYGALGFFLMAGLLANGASFLLIDLDPYFLALVGVSAACLLAFELTSRDLGKPDLATLLLMLALIVVLCLFAAFHFYLPFQSWDTFTHWAPEAADLAQQILAGDQAPLEIGFQKHPIYHYLVLVWSALTGVKYPSAMTGLPWLLCGASLSVIVAGYTYATTNSRPFALIFAIFSVSIPLAENHIILSGYAEIFMVVLLCGGIGCLARGLQLHSIRHILIGLIPVAAVAFIKNIGFIYSFLCVLALCVAVGANNLPRLYFLLLSAVIGYFGFVLAWKLGLSFEINFSFIYFGFNVDSPLIAGKGVQPSIAVGNVYLIFSESSIYQLLKVEAHSKLLLSSFTTCLLIILASLYLVIKNLRDSVPNNLGFFFLVAFTFLVFCLFNFSLQLDDGMKYALPGRDTGFSRMSLLMICVTPLLLGHLVAYCNFSGQRSARGTVA